MNNDNKLDKLTENDVVEFKYINSDGQETGGGCYKVENVHEKEIWLDGDIEEGVIWKPYDGMIAEETKNKELRNFVEIQEVLR